MNSITLIITYRNIVKAILKKQGKIKALLKKSII